MTIAIVDDYEPDRLAVAGCARRYLNEHKGPKAQFRFYPGGREFLAGLSPKAFDLVFLDCCMDGMDGLQTARKLRQRDEAVALIFITSCCDYAVEGYLVSAAGYLVKPYTYDGFSNVFDPVFNRFSYQREMIQVTAGNGQKRILVDDIIFCDVDGHYVIFHLAWVPFLRVRMTFAAITALLDPYPQFLTCYRGCLINLAHTSKAEELNFLMDNGERVPFRRKERTKLLSSYSDYLFEKARGKHV